MGSREAAKRIYARIVLLSLSLVALSAAQSLDTEDVRELVDSGRLNESGDLLQELLFNATADGDVDMLQVLIDFRPAGLNITRGSGEALVHVASFSGQLDALKFLLLRTPEALTAKTEPGLTVWHMAATSGHMAVLRFLLEKWPEGIAVPTYGPVSQGPQSLSFTPPFSAAWGGHVEALRLMLEAESEGSGVERVKQRTGDTGATLLHIAADAGQVEVLRYLHSQWPEGIQAFYAPAPQVDHGSHLPLMSASLWGHLPAVQFLLELWPESINLFAKVDSFNDYLTGGGTCVHYAAVGGSVEVLDFLLDRKPEGAQVKDLTLGRNIPLHWAAAAGSLATARRLLEHWPEGISVRTVVGLSTPLQVAAFYFQVEMALFLLQIPGSLAPDDLLFCRFVLFLGCTLDDPAWKDAAVDLRCNPVSLLSKPDVELWLQCGGDVGFRDSFGTALVDLLTDDEAKEFLESAQISQDPAELPLDWTPWVVCAVALAAAVAVVTMERAAANRCRADADRDEDVYQEGAKRMVAQAFARCVWFSFLWRLLEIFAPRLWYGAAVTNFDPRFWFPLVTFFYLAPAIAIYGPKRLLQHPVLVLASSSPAAYAVALVRAFVLGGLHLALAFYLWGIPGADHEMLGRFFTPLLNPNGHEVVSRVHHVWTDPDNSLQSHWLFQWAGPVTAREVWEFDDRSSFLFLFMLVFLLSLSLVLWLLRFCLPGTSQNWQSCGGKAQVAALQQATRELLKLQPGQFTEVSQGIKPVQGFSWFGGGLYVKLLFMLLDVGLDINTVFVFLSGEQYTVAGIVAFVIARSMLTQMYILKPWNILQAVKDSVARGILRRDLLYFLEEEQRSESIFCAIFTGYSLFFVVTAGEMLIQYLSLWMSLFSFASYMVQVCDLDFPLADSGTDAPQEACSADVVVVTAVEVIATNEFLDLDINEDSVAI